MFKRRTTLLLIIILLIGFISRFYRLGSFPEVFNRDEAAIGYNAYTILTTGKDEFGQKFPLTFTSFGDYKMPLYIYLVTPAIKFFGVNEIAVRFPSAFFGFLTIPLIYLLIKKISQDETTSLAAAFLISISPFHIFYSRLAFEANVANFLLITGFYFMILAPRKPFYYLFSIITLVLSLFCYFSPYILVPLMIIIFLVYFGRQKISIYRKHLIIFLILLTLGYIFAFSRTIYASKAKTNITIFKDNLIWENFAKSRAEHGGEKTFLMKLYDNKFIYYGNIILKNLFMSFSPEFLLFQGAIHPWHKIPQVGNLYFIDILFILIGLYALIRQKKMWSLFILLLLISTIPSAITTDAPHTTRLLFFMTTLLIIAGFGISYLCRFFKQYLWGIIPLLLIIYSYSFGFFLQAYYVHFPKNYSPLWLYGIKDVVSFVNKEGNKYSKIVINDSGESYIYFLFYQKYPLEKYLKTVSYEIDGQGFVHIKGFDKYSFDKQDVGGQIIYVSKDDNLIQNNRNFKIIKKISDPAGRINYFIYTNSI